VKPRLVSVGAAAGLVALVVVACDRRPRSEPLSAAASSVAAVARVPAVASAPAAQASASAPAGLAASLASVQVDPPVGPAPSGKASPDERQRALLSLLSGATSARALPEAATVPGSGFDSGMRRRLTTVEISPEDHSAGLRPAMPVIRMGAVTVKGTLPVEVIQRIVRQSFGRFRLCYENGLRNNPTLSGRVVARFVIDQQGSVSTVADGGSDLPDQATIACVLRPFHGIVFPQPGSGVVVVTYPLSFAPAP
jgi:hypothetical protein